MSTDTINKEDAPEHSPVIRKTSNHIYETCDSTVVLGILKNGKEAREMKPVIQFCRDTIELADGSREGADQVEAVRLNYATITLERSVAERLAHVLIDFLRRTDPEASAAQTTNG